MTLALSALERRVAKWRDLALSLGAYLPGPHILCNLCGQKFLHIGEEHSEGLHCPRCGSIARERVVYRAILDQYCTEAKRCSVSSNRELSSLEVLEFSPRNNLRRRRIYQASFAGYVASDFDQSAHRGDLHIDLTDTQALDNIRSRFDIVIFSHVLEHIPDYRTALANLASLLSPDGRVFFQVPFLEAAYKSASGDEFHGDNTRVYHRFGFDIADELSSVFSSVVLYVGLKDFSISSREISPAKYDVIKKQMINCKVVELGAENLRKYGLGSPDLCEVFVLSNPIT